MQSKTLKNVKELLTVFLAVGLAGSQVAETIKDAVK
jgi:hypothetical protein